MKYYVAYGRFNPPTKAHRMIIDKMIEKAEEDSTAESPIITFVATSFKHDNKKNPLTVPEKVLLMHGVLENDSPAGFCGTLFPDDVIDLGYKLENLRRKPGDRVDVTLFLGTDRVEREDGVYKTLKKYNGQLYNLDSISVEEFKRTDEDISATKLRKAVIDNDRETFNEMFYTDDPESQEEYYKILRERLS